MMSRWDGVYGFMENNDVLLAKSFPPETLLEHTRNCLSVFKAIKQNYPDVPRLCGVEQFYEHLFYAVVLHDVGKGAVGFQSSLRNGTRWDYRHEILSAAFIPCLNTINDIDRRVIALSVITHHKNISELRERFNTTSPVGKERYYECVNDLLPTLRALSALLETIPALSAEFLGREVANVKLPSSISDLVDAYQYAVRWYNNLINNGEIKFLLPYGISLRGFLITCDHLASSGKEKILEGIKDVSQKLTGFNLWSFQRRAKKITGDAFLSAPTGSGKTEASLLWAENNQSGGRRIYYILPYVASINAMYNRLSRHFGEDNVGVLHGKASYFVYKTLLDRSYAPDNAAAYAREIQNLSKKLYRPLKVLTPFQILKALFGVKGWEPQIAEMSGGLFIFDEIHAYDPHVTALILQTIQYLSKLNAKFLFLSATFPNFLKIKIQNILPEISEYCLDEREEDDRRLLMTPRHRVCLLDGEITDHTEKIMKSLGEGRRVLVVCNTVNRAQEMFQTLRSHAQNFRTATRQIHIDG